MQKFANMTSKICNVHNFREAPEDMHMFNADLKIFEITYPKMRNKIFRTNANFYPKIIMGLNIEPDMLKRSELLRRQIIECRKFSCGDPRQSLKIPSSDSWFAVTTASN